MQPRNGAVTLVSAILSLVLTTIVPVRARAQRAVSGVSMSATGLPPDGLAQAMQDTIAARLAALELRRPELLAAGRSLNHPDVVAVDRHLAALRAELSELPNAKAAEEAVNAEVMRAIEARLAGVAVERRIRSADLPANHPDLQAMAKLEAALRQRRSELQESPR